MHEQRPFLDISRIKKSYPVSRGMSGNHDDKVHAVNDVSLSVEKGETLGLVGESGCGKSTLARLIICLEKPDAGTISFKGRDVFMLNGHEKKEFRKSVQMVFQDTSSSLNPRQRIGNIIGEPLLVHNLVPRREIQDRVADLMVSVGLQKDVMKRFPHEFSSGQRQRIGIARALSVHPELIIADEPVSALDVSIQAQILNLFLEVQEKMHLTYVFISHYLNVVRHVSTRVAVMYLGKIVETAPCDILYNNPLHPYTEALLSAVPSPDPTGENKRIILKGDSPSPMNLPKGCVFSSRCRYAEKDICFEKQPPLSEKESGQKVACWLRT